MSMTDTYSETLLIKDVFVAGKSCDVFIKDGYFTNIAPNLGIKADITLNGKNKMLLPSFANSYTSAVLNLLRGFVGECPFSLLQSRYITPLEGYLSEDDVYWGTMLACLEMIKSGTTFFADNGPHWWGTAKAVHEMGMRSVLSLSFEDNKDNNVIIQMKKRIKEIHYSSRSYSKRIDIALTSAAIEELPSHSLHWLAEYAAEHKLHVHTPLSRTPKEVQHSLACYGKRPLHRLDAAGLVNKRFSAVYGVCLDDSEIEIMAERGGKIIHCPSAAMKLALPQIDYQKIEDAGIPLLLGTDGSLLSGHQNMLQEARMNSLLAKNSMKAIEVFSAVKSLRMATQGAAIIFGINNGEIAEGKLADCILLDLNHPSLIPNHNDLDNFVYGAYTGAIETTICNGTILMHNRKVPNEERIIEKGKEAVARILSRIF